MDLLLTRDESDADMVLELRHDLFTKYVFSIVDTRSPGAPQRKVKFAGRDGRGKKLQSDLSKKSGRRSGRNISHRFQLSGDGRGDARVVFQQREVCAQRRAFAKFGHLPEQKRC